MIQARPALRDAGRVSPHQLRTQLRWALANYYLLLSAATPGSSLPSRNSRLAPPPVETCVICLATPAFFTALALSPPPMTVVAPDSANIFARANVPSANFGISNTPTGPFHTISFAPLRVSLYNASVFGPTSSMRQPAGILST